MSDYCNCCSTNAQHIADHYDPGGTITGDEDPATLLEEFQDQWGDECDLELADVEKYVYGLRCAKA